VNSSSDYFSVKSRRMRWAGHVEIMGKRRGAYWVLVGTPAEKKATWETWVHWRANEKEKSLGLLGYNAI